LLMPFGHVGDGNIHFNCVLPETSAEQYEARILDYLFDKVSSLGGSISAEHGVGRLKADAIWKRKSELELRLSLALKDLLDPGAVLNPGIMFGRARPPQQACTD
jgi:FAD/FMN-containing dehydrogenase